MTGRKLLPPLIMWDVVESPIWHEAVLIRGRIYLGGLHVSQILHPIGKAQIEHSTVSMRERILTNISTILMERDIDRHPEQFYAAPLHLLKARRRS